MHIAQTMICFALVKNLDLFLFIPLLPYSICTAGQIHFGGLPEPVVCPGDKSKPARFHLLLRAWYLLNSGLSTYSNAKKSYTPTKRKKSWQKKNSRCDEVVVPMRYGCCVYIPASEMQVHTTLYILWYYGYSGDSATIVDVAWFTMKTAVEMYSSILSIKNHHIP